MKIKIVFSHHTNSRHKIPTVAWFFNILNKTSLCGLQCLLLLFFFQPLIWALNRTKVSITMALFTKVKSNKLFFNVITIYWLDICPVVQLWKKRLEVICYRQRVYTLESMCYSFRGYTELLKNQKVVYDIYHLPLHLCICHISVQAFIYHLQIKLLTSWARSLSEFFIFICKCIQLLNIISCIAVWSVNHFRPSLGCKRFLPLITVIRNISLATCFLHHCCTTSVMQLSPYAWVAHSISAVFSILPVENE